MATRPPAKESSKTQYEVLRGFAHAGTYYTRDNQREVASLPAALLTRYEEMEYIRRLPDDVTTTATPTTPTTPAGGAE